MAKIKEAPTPPSMEELQANPKWPELIEYLSELITVEKEKLLRELDSELILEELAFFRVAYRNLQEVVSGKARENALKAHERKSLALAESDKYIDEALKLFGEIKNIPPDKVVLQILMDMSVKKGEFIFDSKTKCIYDPNKKPLSIVSENRVKSRLEEKRRQRKEQLSEFISGFTS